jgi:hypothetical protein
VQDGLVIEAQLALQGQSDGGAARHGARQGCPAWQVQRTGATDPQARQPHGLGKPSVRPELLVALVTRVGLPSADNRIHAP